MEGVVLVEAVPHEVVVEVFRDVWESAVFSVRDGDAFDRRNNGLGAGLVELHRIVDVDGVGDDVGRDESKHFHCFSPMHDESCGIEKATYLISYASTSSSSKRYAGLMLKGPRSSSVS